MENNSSYGRIYQNKHDINIHNKCYSYWPARFQIIVRLEIKRTSTPVMGVGRTETIRYLATQCPYTYIQGYLYEFDYEIEIRGTMERK